MLLRTDFAWFLGLDFKGRAYGFLEGKVDL